MNNSSKKLGALFSARFLRHFKHDKLFAKQNRKSRLVLEEKVVDLLSKQIRDRNSRRVTPPGTSRHHDNSLELVGTLDAEVHVHGVVLDLRGLDFDALPDHHRTVRLLDRQGH